MINKKILSASLLILGLVTNIAHSAEFTLGVGAPFFLVPEVSIASEDEKKRWFGNYKMGLDDGFSFGFEHGIGSENKHALGVVVGALGVQSDDKPCSYEKTDDFTENLGSAIGCSLLLVFSEETTNGLGLSYSYNFNGLNNSGVRIRFEFGYGEGAKSNERRTDGGVVISYQF